MSKEMMNEFCFNFHHSALIYLSVLESPAVSSKLI